MCIRDRRYVDHGKYIDPLTQKPVESADPNMIASGDTKLSINDRKTFRNNNFLVLGGAGTGKSRFVIKPNLLQENCSYVVTDPSGEIIVSLGKVLLKDGYDIKIFNLSNMAHSNTCLLYTSKQQIILVSLNYPLLRVQRLK